MKIKNSLKLAISILLGVGFYLVFAGLTEANSQQGSNIAKESSYTNSQAPLISKNVHAEKKCSRPGISSRFSELLVKAAHERTTHRVVYDGKYRKIKYPMGDVPPGVGVCTDVIIRSYRKLGIDLQKEVHLDMKRNFGKYPKNWGLKRTDTNIDHRRVPNLRTFFTRKGKAFNPSNNPEHFFPGDLVTWVLPGNLPHIGIVTEKKSEDGLRPLIVHNIGAGPVLEDMLFDYKITGIYSYQGP